MKAIEFIKSAATLAIGTAVLALPVLGFQHNLAQGMTTDAAMANCLAPFLSIIGM